ncbi:MAG: hypothetical protein KA165_18320, partial [Saprospiraceae bacterium]|nr:hypothetical protein [Saprospiraceae bacterium]
MKNFSSGPARRFVAAALLIAIVVLLFQLTARQTDPYHALPSQSAFVFEFRGLEKCLLLKNATTDPLWAGILNTDAFRNAWQDAATARALFAHDPALAEAFARGTLIDGISLNRPDSLHGLFVLDAEENLDIPNLLKNSELAKKVFPAVFHGNTIYDVYLPDKRRMVVASVGHLLLFSKYSYLVEDALSQIGETRSWWANRHLADKMNPGAPFHLYCRPEMLTLRYTDSMLPAWKGAPEVISSSLKW